MGMLVRGKTQKKTAMGKPALFPFIIIDWSSIKPFELLKPNFY